MSTPSPEFVREFLESMPRAYRAAHDLESATPHARVSLERAAAPAQVGLLPADRGAQAVLCVVADDRPGLLATISAALVLADIDVVDAEAHTRRTPAGRAEAVDLFWVQRSDRARRGEPFVDGDVERVREHLFRLLEGKLDVDKARPSELPRGRPETVVRFIESEHGDLGVLEVETGDRSGLLLALSRALFEQRVQIEQSEVKTVGDRVRDRFHIVELDGSPIGPERRLEIQVAVLGALDR